MNDKEKLKLFNEFLKHIPTSRCACKICHRLREAYFEELRSKIPEGE